MEDQVRGQAGPSQKRKTTEQLIARFDINAFQDGRLRELRVSPDNRRIAYIADAQEGVRVVIDQSLGRTYNNVWAGSLSFSPDSQAVTYLATRGSHSFVISGDQEYGPYDQMIDCSPTFSADSQHFAYAAQQKEKAAVFRDSELVGQFEGLGDRLTYSPDGCTLAFRARSGEKEYIISNERVGNPYDRVGNPRFSLDSSRLAYVARRDGKWFVVVDEQEGRPFEHALHPVFSPDSQRLAYYAGNEKSWFVVVDDEPMGPYFEFSIGEKRSFKFSPDSNRLACIGSEREKWFAFRRLREFVVVDNVEGRRYMDAANLRFSPDSKRLAYLASRTRRTYVIVDGEEHGPYTAVGPASPVFSPDSKRVAYSARAQNKWAAYIDGIRSGTHHKRAKTPVFSPDSHSIAYTVATTEGFVHVVVNDDHGPAYRSIFMSDGDGIVFDSPSNLHYIANSNDEHTLLVTEHFSSHPQT